jgi:hypothetical protein
MKSKNKVREPAAENQTGVACTRSSVVVETEAMVGRGSQPMCHPEPSGALIKSAPSNIRVNSRPPVPSPRGLAVKSGPSSPLAVSQSRTYLPLSPFQVSKKPGGYTHGWQPPHANLPSSKVRVELMVKRVRFATDSQRFDPLAGKTDPLKAPFKRLETPRQTTFRPGIAQSPAITSGLSSHTWCTGRRAQPPRTHRLGRVPSGWRAAHS